MLRAVLGTIAGYVVFAALLFALFSGAYLAIGVERTFQPGSYASTPLWLVIAFALGLAAAVCGGYVARKVGGPGGPKGMIALFVLGTAVEIAVTLSSDAPPKPPRPADVGVIEAAKNAEKPVWVTAGNLVLGVAGVLIGASKAARKR